MFDKLYSISMAVYNNLEVTKKCIDGLFNSLEDVSYEILIVDNNSDRETKDYLEELMNAYSSKVTVTSNDENEGFIKAQNFNLLLAEGKYFVVFNNDIEILSRSSNWIETMRKKFEEDPMIRIVGVSEMCGELDSNGNGYRSGKLGVLPEYVEGSCLMIEKQFAREIGLFDTRYTFGYCEDSDLSLRVREMGYKIDTIDAPLLHHQYTTGRKVERFLDLEGYMVINHIEFRKRWGHYLMNKDFNYKYLLRRTGGWGDVLLTTPIVRHLKEKNPNCTVDIETACVDIFNNNPYVDHIYSERVPMGGYDYIIDFNNAYEKRPKMHIVEAYIDAYEKLSGNVFNECGEVHIPKLYLSDSELQYAEELLPLSKQICLVHFDTDKNWVGRTISKSKQEEIINNIKDRGYLVAILNADSHWEASEGILPLRNLTVRKLMSIVSKVNVFLGIDSFPFHIAQAFHIPSIVAFGSIDPKYRTFESLLPIVLVRNEKLNCLGCHHILPSPRVVTTTCSRDGKHSIPLCMSSLTTEDFMIGLDSYEKYIKNLIKK